MINKFKLLLLSSFLLLPVISNCTGVNSAYNNTNNSGYVMASVKFPQKGFNIKKIPDKTALILVRISGEGIDNKRPLSVDLYRDNPTRIISAVPQGDKEVRANAFDVNGNLLASGKNTVKVIAEKLTRVEVELEELKPNSDNNDDPDDVTKPSTSPTPIVSPTPNGGSIEPSPIATPKDEPCIVKVSLSDMPLSSSLELAIEEAGCKILYPTATPTPTPNGGGGGSSSTSNSINANVTVVDGNPIDVLTIETPIP